MWQKLHTKDDWQPSAFARLIHFLHRDAACLFLVFATGGPRGNSRSPHLQVREVLAKEVHVLSKGQRGVSGRLQVYTVSAHPGQVSRQRLATLRPLDLQ